MFGLKSTVNDAEGNERKVAVKKYSILGLIVLSILIGSTAAMGLTIDDTGTNAYWGGVLYTGGPSVGDVIGNGFALDGIDVSINGSKMTVKVIGPYFSTFGSSFTDGDLYISSTGWFVNDTTGNSPGSKVPSAQDTFKTDGSEHWDYVVGTRLDSIVPVTHFTPGVFNLDFGAVGNSAFHFTNDVLSNGSAGRSLQAWKGGYGSTFFETATITPDYAHNMLIYQFDDSFLPNVNNVGFHWTMDCGNDVVEGQGTPTVPEPGSLLLLGLGSVGLGICRRRAARK